MRALDSIDLLVICADASPVEQGINLICWAVKGVPTEDAIAVFNHPSFQWWALKHAADCTRIASHEGWYERLR